MTMQFSTPMIEVGIVTDNTDAMLRFYRDVLGLPFLAELKYPGGSQQRFSCGDSVLKLATFDHASKNPSPPGGPFGGVQGMRYISFMVKNLRQIVSDVRAAGYNVPTEPTEFSAGNSFAFIQDPDGNWIELYGP
jgi:catechol 2,3-dioxygenase-like lactoylglutathione lyase family enzyme